VAVLGCIYFWKISKEWLWLELFACAGGFISMLTIFLIPESPKFLITMKRYDDARKAIEYISKINRYVDGTFSRQFDREVADRKTKTGGLNNSGMTTDFNSTIIT
jgi:hypothetical protein